MQTVIKACVDTDNGGKRELDSKPSPFYGSPEGVNMFISDVAWRLGTCLRAFASARLKNRVIVCIIVKLEILICALPSEALFQRLLG